MMGKVPSKRTENDATEILKTVGKATPLEPFENGHKKWKAKCKLCSKVIYPKLNKVKHKNFIACADCSKKAYLKERLKGKESEAKKVFINAGLIPQTSFPGVNKSWKSMCKKCKKIVNPRLSTVQSGSGCKYCKRKTGSQKQKITKDRAEILFRKYDFQLIGNFKDIYTKSKVKCTKCGKNLLLSYRNLQHKKHCKYCLIAERKIKIENKAIAEMKQRNLDPQEPYKFSRSLWKCKCMKCKKIGSYSHNAVTVRNRKCIYCTKMETANKRRTSIDEVRSAFRNADLRMIGNYVSAHKLIEAECLKCGKIIQKTYASVNGGTGCRYCSGNTVDAKDAKKKMEKFGYKPLVPYPGAHTPWKSKHIKCNKTVFPHYSTIRSGEGGCSYCADFGINMESPSYIYWIQHEKFQAMKIGIGNVNKVLKNDRLHRHLIKGWAVLHNWNFDTGWDAIKIEQAIFKYLKSEFKVQPFLSEHEMPHGGWTETFDPELIEHKQLKSFIEKQIKLL